MGVGIEGANGVHFIAEQVHAIGHRRAHGEEVDEATTHGVFTRGHHLAHVLVACQCELRLEPGFVEPHLLFEVEGVAGHESRRRQPREGRGGGQKHNIQVAVFDAPQRGKSLRDEVLVRREGVVGQGLPVREEGHAQGGREEGHLIGQALGIGRVGADDGEQAFVAQRGQ